MQQYGELMGVHEIRNRAGEETVPAGVRFFVACLMRPALVPGAPFFPNATISNSQHRSSAQHGSIQRERHILWNGQRTSAKGSMVSPENPGDPLTLFELEVETEMFRHDFHPVSHTTNMVSSLTIDTQARRVNRIHTFGVLEMPAHPNLSMDLELEAERME
jgi:hypothetical protein